MNFQSPPRLIARWTGILVVVLPLMSALQGAVDPRISQITPPQFESGTVRSLDMDGDGDTDLLRERSYGLGSVWIENRGGRMFSEPKVYRYDQAVNRSWFGDLNGDGLLDTLQQGSIADANGARSITVSLSGPALSEALRVDLGKLQGGFQLLELGGDSRVEILRLETGESGVLALSIGNLLEDGSLGLWAGPYHLPAETGLDDSKAVDADGDGDLDLHLGGWILKRTGQQTFSTVFHPAAKPAFDSVAGAETKWADLDGDGLRDVFTFFNDTLKWARNLGGFVFVEKPPVSIAGELLSVMDVPASGAVLTFSESIANGSANEWHIKQVLASGAVLTDKVLASGDWPVAIIQAEPTLVWDFDGDGLVDVFRAARVFPGLPYQNERRSWPAMDWGSATGFHAMVPIIEAPLCRQISSAFADFDTDGNADLALGPDVLGRFMFLEGDGRGRFLKKRFLGELLPAEFEEIGVRIDSVKSGDVDADGDADLLVNLVRIPSLGSTQHLACYALNSGDGIFSLPDFPAGTFDFIMGGSGGGDLYDWDGDGDLDVVGSAWQENEGGVLSQSATPLLSAATGTDIFGNPVLVGGFQAGDLDGDGRSDIISEVFSLTQGGILLGGMIESSTMGIGFSDAFGAIEEVAEIPVQAVGTDLFGNLVSASGSAIIDVNLDGHNDLVFSGITGSDALGNMLVSSFWKRNPGNGSRLVANWVTLPLSISYPSPQAGDFNGDGLADYSDGTSFLTPRPSGPLISPEYDFMGGRFVYKPGVAHLADLDGDGDEDLIVSENGELNLVRNLIIDERSGVAARLRVAGVLGQLANPEKDADGDGRDNATEFLQGTNPQVPDAADPDRAQPSLVVSVSDLTLHYENRADAAELDLVYQLESSENLKDWTPVEEAGATHQPLSHGWRQTTLPQEGIHSRAFYRVHMRHEVPVVE